MKKTPLVSIEIINLFCPDCGEELEEDICPYCGCEIDINEMQVDIQPAEILEHVDQR